MLLHVPGAAHSSLPSQQSHTPSFTNALGTRRGTKPAFAHTKCPRLHAAVCGSSLPSAQSQ